MSVKPRGSHSKSSARSRCEAGLTWILPGTPVASILLADVEQQPVGLGPLGLEQVEGIVLLTHEVVQGEKGHTSGGNDVGYEEPGHGGGGKITISPQGRLDDGCEEDESRIGDEPQNCLPPPCHRQGTKWCQQRPDDDGAGVDEPTKGELQQERQQEDQEELDGSEGVVPSGCGEEQQA